MNDNSIFKITTKKYVGGGGTYCFIFRCVIVVFNLYCAFYQVSFEQELTIDNHLFTLLN